MAAERPEIDWKRWFSVVDFFWSGFLLDRIANNLCQISSAMLESIPYVNVWVKQQAVMIPIKVMLLIFDSIEA